MSLLSASPDDFGGQGKPLPPREYVVTVLEAKVEPTANGKRLTRMYGNIRTKEGATEFTNGDGAPYRIGNRKLFARSWIEHTSPKAAEIGQREIKREALSAGLLAKPAKGTTTELDFPSWETYANELTGKDVIVRTKLSPRWRDKNTNQIVREPTPEAMAAGDVVRSDEAEVATWLQP